MGEPTCSVAECDKPVFVKKRQLCKLHYNRFARHGDPEAYKRKKRSYCSVEGCDLGVAANGLCDLHYRRLRRYGTTDAPSRPEGCSIEGCTLPHQAHGLCDKHYRRERTGNLDARPCRWCGEPIDPNTHARSVFCSDQCSEKWNYLDRREKYRGEWLKQYGLTVDDYNAMLARQHGVCALCGSEERIKRVGHLAVDHCHRTGRVRGLLCHDCNTGLGKFKDDPALLLKAVAHLA